MNEKVIRGASLVLLLIVAGVVIYMLFSFPKNIRQAIDRIDSAQVKIDESMQVLERQQQFLDSIVQRNEELLTGLDSIRFRNDMTEDTILKRLSTAHDYLWTINNNLKQFPTDFNRPE